MIDLELKSCLVIPDIHLAHHIANGIIECYPDVGSIVLLGDTFDNFNDTPEMNAQSAEWLKSIIENPKVIPLLGNHDAPYLFDVPEFKTCPGYTEAKRRAIRRHLASESRRFRLACKINGWMLSHAGVNPYYWNSSADVDEAEQNLRFGIYNRLFHNGYRMSPTGATVPPGGIMWQDWDHEFRQIPDVPQIVGHTPARDVRVHNNGYGGTGVCLDTQLMYHGIIDQNGVLSIVNRHGKTIQTVEQDD